MLVHLSDASAAPLTHAPLDTCPDSLKRPPTTHSVLASSALGPHPTRKAYVPAQSMHTNRLQGRCYITQSLHCTSPLSLPQHSPSLSKQLNLVITPLFPPLYRLYHSSSLHQRQPLRKPDQLRPLSPCIPLPAAYTATNAQNKLTRHTTHVTRRERPYPTCSLLASFAPLIILPPRANLPTLMILTRHCYICLDIHRSPLQFEPLPKTLLADPLHSSTTLLLQPLYMPSRPSCSLLPRQAHIRMPGAHTQNSNWCGRLRAGHTRSNLPNRKTRQSS